MTVKIVNPTPWPETFRFLLGTDVTDATDKGPAALKDVDLLIVVDIADVKRLGSLANTVRGMKAAKVVIDHHIPSDEPPSNNILADTTACATGELIYDVAVTLGLEITPEIASALYVAVLTDTGGFRFSNTSARCITRWSRGR